MKKLILLLVAVILIVGLLAGCDFFDWLFPEREKTITITWFSDGIRYNAEGEELQRWINDPNGPATLIQDDGGWCFADVKEFYNDPTLEYSGIVFITETGRLSGYATYISGRSGLFIKDYFEGEVEIIVYDGGDGTMVGTCNQWGYAYAESVEDIAILNDEDIGYPGAVEALGIGPDWWFIGSTDYITYPR